MLFQFLESLENLCSNLLLLLSINLYVMFEININLAVHWQEVGSSKFGKGWNTLLNVSSLYQGK